MVAGVNLARRDQPRLVTRAALGRRGLTNKLTGAIGVRVELAVRPVATQPNVGDTQGEPTGWPLTTEQARRACG